MKNFKKLALTLSVLAGSFQTANAIPTFHELVESANSAPGHHFIDESSFDSEALVNDALWNKMANSKVMFKSEISGYNNAMGYANADGSNETIILNEGDSGWRNLTGAPDQFVFFLDTQQGNNWFSDNSLNTDGKDHMLAFQKKDGSDNYLLFWDDQYGGGDRDYNDFVARVKLVSPAPVPEPGSLALLGLGLAGLGLSRRRLKKA